MLKNKLEKINIGLYPTPIHELKNTSKYIYNVNKLYIKRDDLCGRLLGSNKIRKLEYLFMDAKKMSATTIITTGGPQSNHASLTAATAIYLGYKCELWLTDDGVTQNKGNLLINNLMDIDIFFRKKDILYSSINSRIEELEKKGEKVYFIPMGGSNDIGTYAYTNCVKEISYYINKESINIDHIVTTTGSCGTHAGIQLGIDMYLKNIKLTGISILGKTQKEQIDIIKKLYDKAAIKAGLDYRLNKNDINVFDYSYPGYAISNEKVKLTIKKLAKYESILLDPVYTGKAFYGMIDLCRKDYFKGENVLFIHTGGSPALFALEI